MAPIGEQAVAIFGQRFPLLAKFIDAHARLSIQVHPDDAFAAHFEGGRLGKTECWYILAAEAGAKIVHGFKQPTTPARVRSAIERAALAELLHEEGVVAGDVIFVPAGTVHAIGGGIMLYELQEYSDITYRMYDFGRLTSAGAPRELHVERSLAVSHTAVSARVKATPVQLAGGASYTEGSGTNKQDLVDCEGQSVLKKAEPFMVTITVHYPHWETRRSGAQWSCPQWQIALLIIS